VETRPTRSAAARTAPFTLISTTVMTPLSIRPGERGDQAAILALAERLGAFGPTTRSAQEIAARERRALADALARPSPGSALLVATSGIAAWSACCSWRRGGTTSRTRPMDTWRFSAVAREAEGQGVGQALLDAADEWGRRRGFRRLTLAVFADNAHAKDSTPGWGGAPSSRPCSRRF